ncbi:hypothetical protein IFM89_011275 [Coptis chinensis]|uniref:DOG1 domain-containing protein n=1 Tax=Coptis chinensis TaxID=261450 RepID=A0A835HAR3_9MAGN|nr:hypothetical protein IFM89_011275 [Coptis chinensis]
MKRNQEPLEKDVFAMFSPSWFSTYERTYLWIAGFKPGIPFKLVNKYIADLSEEQLQRMNTFRAEMGTRERKLTNELAQVQESVASSYLVGLGRRQVEEREERRQADEAVSEMKEMMVTLVQSADLLRMTIVRGIVEILRPVQCVKFLATAAQLHLRIRMIGLEKDASRNRGSRT